jgi:hypothetical protein
MTEPLSKNVIANALQKARATEREVYTLMRYLEDVGLGEFAKTNTALETLKDVTASLAKQHAKVSKHDDT